MYRYRLVFIKGEDHYIFVWNNSTRLELLRTLGRLASNPDLNFTWRDGARLSAIIGDIHRNLNNRVKPPEHSVD